MFQARACNAQIPAKLYEYLRARRPVLAVTDTDGDTTRVLRDAGLDTIVQFDSKASISEGLPRFLERLRDGTAPIAPDRVIASYDRRNTAQALAPQAEHLLRDIAALPVGPSALLICASRIPGGALLKILGRDHEAARRCLCEKLAFLTDLLGDDPWSRKG